MVLIVRKSNQSLQNLRSQIAERPAAVRQPLQEIMELFEPVFLEEDLSKDRVPQLGDHLVDHLQFVEGRLPDLVILKIRQIGGFHLLDGLLGMALELDRGIFTLSMWGFKAGWLLAALPLLVSDLCCLFPGKTSSMPEVSSKGFSST